MHPAAIISAAKRILLVSAMALVGLNLWTGSPLLAIWIGSRVEANIGALSMTAVGAVLLALAVQSVILTLLLGRLEQAYDRLTGRTQRMRRSSWLKSLSGERGRTAAQRGPSAPVERVVVIMVVAAVLMFEVWFFVFAKSSLVQG
jgi:hypothetical protein